MSLHNLDPIGNSFIFSLALLEPTKRSGVEIWVTNYKIPAYVKLR